MPKLSPRDDYPDSADRAPSGTMPFRFHDELEGSSRGFRAWVKASPRRCLSADGKALVVSRPTVYVRPRETAPYETLLRKPKKGETFFWTVELYELVEGKRQAILAILPRGVTVAKVSFDADRIVLAMKREDGSKVDATVTRDALRSMPRAYDVLRGKADHDAAFAKLVTPGAVRAAPRAKKRAPTMRDYRTALVASLAKLRPMLLADLRSRVFVHPIPDGAKELAFEVHFGPLDQVPVVGYWMDGQNGQVQTRDRKGKPALVPNVDILPGTPILADAVREPFAEADLDITGVAPPLVLRWFIDAWRAAAKTKAFPLPASIQFHDSIHVTKLT